MVLVLLFALRGFLRGTVAQVFVAMGLLAGLWAAALVAGWVGARWEAAQPALVFQVLRWMVAALAGLAVASVFHWWGHHLGRAVREGPLGWLDRGGGLVVGTLLGAVVCVFALLAALVIERPRAAGAEVAQARLSAPALGVAAAVCGFGEAYLPGCGWLKERFLAAERRAVRLRGDRAAS